MKLITSDELMRLTTHNIHHNTSLSRVRRRNLSGAEVELKARGVAIKSVCSKIPGNDRDCRYAPRVGQCPEFRALDVTLQLGKRESRVEKTGPFFLRSF